MPSTRLSQGEVKKLADANHAGESYLITVDEGEVRIGRARETVRRSSKRFDTDAPGEVTATKAGESLFAYGVEPENIIEYEIQGWTFSLFGRQVVTVQNLTIPFDAVTRDFTMSHGSVELIEADGRPNVMVQWTDVTSDGTIHVETSPDDVKYWPFESIQTSGEGFAQLPFVADNWVKVTSDGFEGAVKVGASR